MKKKDKYLELIETVKSVSNGSIVKKIIKEKEYFYFQYYKLGKTKSFYIPKSKLEEVRTILKDKNIKNSNDKELLSNTKNLPSLSKNAKELTGFIMSGDEVVAKYDKGELEYIDEKKCPLLIKRTHNVNLFLSSRAIDAGRANARLLKKTLNIKEKEDYLVSQYNYGATITDNYWFKPLYSKLKYEDISFSNDFYGDLALNGSLNFLPINSKHTPQLTLTGSFEKCWKKEGKYWWLYKKGNIDNIFSELFVSRLSDKLGFNTAIYEYDSGNVKTLNFANRLNFEPMSSIATDDDSYENVFRALESYSKKIKKDYLKIIWLDTIVYNVDRHNENAGLLRDRTTGKVEMLAPNFDNNLALSGSGKNLKDNNTNDTLIKLFLKFMNNNLEAKKLFLEIKFKEITKELLTEIYNSLECDYKNKDVIDFIYTRYLYLKEKLSAK